MTGKPSVDAAKCDARFFLANIKALADPERNRAAYAREAIQECLMAAAYDTRRAEAVIEAAERGDPIARQAVHQAIMGFVSTETPLPQRLREYLAELLILRDYGPKRKAGHKTYLRDDYIRHAVKVVCEHGFDRTRNEATREKATGAAGARSACAIVREVLREFGVDLDEKTIENISNPRSR